MRRSFYIILASFFLSIAPTGNYAYSQDEDCGNPGSIGLTQTEQDILTTLGSLTQFAPLFDALELLGNNLNGLVTSLQATVTQWVGNVTTTFNNVVSSIAEVANFQSIADGFQNTVNGLSSQVNTWVSNVTTTFNDVTSSIAEVVNFQSIADGFQNTVNGLSSQVNTWVGDVSSTFNNVVSSIAEVANFQGIVDTVQNTVNNLSSTVTNLSNDVGSTISSTLDAITSTNTYQGIVNTMQSTLNTAEAAVNSVLGFLGINGMVLSENDEADLSVFTEEGESSNYISDNENEEEDGPVASSPVMEGIDVFIVNPQGNPSDASASLLLLTNPNATLTDEASSVYSAESEGNAWGNLWVNPTLIDPVFEGEISGLTPGSFGLDQVDNTADLDKPISIALEQELLEKIQLSDIEPSTSNSPCEIGEVYSGADFFYVCVAPNTWKRTSLNSNW